MIRRTLALYALLGLALLLTDCAPQPSPTHTPTPDLGLHLLVEATGDLSHKRPGWEEYLPLSFGTALDRQDLLRAASGAEGLIVCADLSLAPVPPGYFDPLPCPPQAEPVLMRGESLMVGPRRDAAPVPSIPYVLSPRHTFIQTPDPLLRWHPSGTGTVAYTIRVWGGALDWQVETTATELPYPDDAPALEPGVSYRLTVADAGGRSSDEEHTALDLSFSLLPPEEVAGIQALVAQAQGLDLDERAMRLLEAEIYAAHELRGDAIPLLQQLSAREDAPAVHGRLGDLYSEVGLYTEAREAHEQSLAGYRALGDRAGGAAALVGLGLACWGDGDDATARDYLEQARDLYLALGDAGGVVRVERVLAEIGR